MRVYCGGEPTLAKNYGDGWRCERCGKRIRVVLKLPHLSH